MYKRISIALIIIVIAIITAIIIVKYQTQPSMPSIGKEETWQKIDAGKLAKQAQESIDRGIRFLLSRQAQNGSWTKHPAYTALAVMAIYGGPDSVEIDTAVNKGLDYILKFVQKDGSIWSQRAKEYPNYTTSIALLALTTVNRKEDFDVMKQARQYLLSSQFRDKNTIDYGGIGYGKTGRADISNHQFATEALYYTDWIDREPYTTDREAAKKSQEMWKRTIIFLTNSQHLPNLNKQKWVIKDKEHDSYGGFIYRPNESKVGNEGETLLSSGSMTYAGLKSMIYSNVDKSDIRVKGAIDYLKRHYTLKENPGMGLQGLYYYLHMMVKALDAYGEATFIDSTGKTHNWRAEVINEFISLQNKTLGSKEYGSWKNKHGRYFESTPELATSYALISIKIALDKNNR